MLKSKHPHGHVTVVFGLNFLINFVSHTSLVLIRLLIHLSTHLCHHPHSFTPGSKPTFSTNHYHLNRLFTLLSVTNKVQPSYLHNLISLQPLHSTRSSQRLPYVYGDHFMEDN